MEVSIGFFAFDDQIQKIFWRRGGGGKNKIKDKDDFFS